MADPRIHTGTASVHGASLYYEIAGEGRPVVLLHAGIADCRMWDAQMATFAREFLVLRYDMRGFGRSSLPPGEFAPYDDLAGLLDALGLDSAALVGASMGGAVALDFALTYPERVEGLVLAAASAGGMPYYSPAILRGWEALEAALERGDKEAAIEIDLRMWVDGPQRTPDQVDADLRARVRAMNAPLYDLPQGISRERRLDPPALARLGEITAPTLILAGALDMTDMMTLAERLQAGIAGSRMAVVSHVAHLINLERPLKFDELALGFLRSL